MTLQQELAREFETSAITVNINDGTYLTIMFSNSPTAELPDSDQAAFARRVAEYVRDQYPRYDSLKTIAIGFAKVTGVGPITYTDSRVPYTFTPQDLGRPRHAAKGPAS
jgi:hypothetical protein